MLREWSHDTRFTHETLDNLQWRRADTNYGYALTALAAMVSEGAAGGQSYLCSMLKTASEPPRSKPNPADVGVAPFTLSTNGAECIRRTAQAWEHLAADTENIELKREAEALSVDLASHIIGHLHGSLCMCVSQYLGRSLHEPMTDHASLLCLGALAKRESGGAGRVATVIGSALQVHDSGRRFTARDAGELLVFL